MMLKLKTLIILVLLIIISIGNTGCNNDKSQGWFDLMDEAITAMQSSSDVNVTPECLDEATYEGEIVPCLTSIIESNGTIMFTSNNSTLVSSVNSGLIIYPGGSIDPRAYAVAAQTIAKTGFKVFIVPMKGMIAFTGITRADKVISENNDTIDNWFMAGHSLGGVGSIMYIKNSDNSSIHTDEVLGLILWGTYCTPSIDISENNTTAVLSIYGTKDGLSTVEEILGISSVSSLPASTQYEAIVGGNHSQFGYYGGQDGDFEADITREEQHNQFISKTIDFMNTVLGGLK
ncbi:alpha/beta hydrolase [Spirochaetota bacterium]